MRVNIRKLAAQLDAAQVHELGRIQRLEAKRKGLVKQEKELALRLSSVTKRRKRVEKRIDRISGDAAPERARRAKSKNKKRKISAAARRRMAEGARRRWAKARAEKQKRRPETKQASRQVAGTTG